MNVSVTTHHHSTSSSLIDLVFVNDMTKVMLYKPISASCSSKHNLLSLTYNLSVTPYNKRITYRDFRDIDFAILNSSNNNTYWDRIYSLDNVNDQLAPIQENVCLLYDRCVPVRLKLKLNRGLMLRLKR